MRQTRTAAQTLCDLLLEEPVEVWARRHVADERSWPWIARKLTEVTNGKVQVAAETLRAWALASVDA